jgi:hypothetical protein
VLYRYIPVVLLSFTAAASASLSCPDAAALSFFENQIAYERTQVINPFKGFRELHADVWRRGSLSAFYVRDRPADFGHNVRMAYVFDKGGWQGGGTCATAKSWRVCVEEFAGAEDANDAVGTCAITLDMAAIPTWRPSPNDETKRRIANELRREIQTQWHGVQEIVVRDFNLKDGLIKMYLKMPDGDYYESCGFHAFSEPHCDNWAIFGSSPPSDVRPLIFDKPYRLK